MTAQCRRVTCGSGPWSLQPRGVLSLGASSRLQLRLGPPPGVQPAPRWHSSRAPEGSSLAQVAVGAFLVPSALPHSQSATPTLMRAVPPDQGAWSPRPAQQEGGSVLERGDLSSLRIGGPTPQVCRCSGNMIENSEDQVLGAGCWQASTRPHPSSLTPGPLPPALTPR